MAKVRTVARAIKILKLLANNPGMTLSEISSSLGIPKSSTYDLLHTMADEGIIRPAGPDLKSFSLGLTAFEIGSAYLTQIDLRALAHPYLRNLMLETQATAFLVVEDGGEIVYLDKIEPPSMARTTIPLGSRRKMYHNGLGKAILATYPAEQVMKVVGDESSMIPFTRYTITDFRTLLSDLKTTRKRGYAVDNRESSEDICCLAAPVLDADGKAIGAVSVSFLFSQFRSLEVEKTAKKVVEAAEQISRGLGYQGDRLFSSVDVTA